MPLISKKQLFEKAFVFHPREMTFISIFLVIRIDHNDMVRQ